MSSFNSSKSVLIFHSEEFFLRGETDFDFHLDSHSCTKSWEKKKVDERYLSGIF